MDMSINKWHWVWSHHFFYFCCFDLYVKAKPLPSPLTIESALLSPPTSYGASRWRWSGTMFSGASSVFCSPAFRSVPPAWNLMCFQPHRLCLRVGWPWERHPGLPQLPIPAATITNTIPLTILFFLYKVISVLLYYWTGCVYPLAPRL